MPNGIIIRDLVKRINEVVGSVPRPVPLHEPQFGSLERGYVLDALDTGWVSSVGEYVARFEEQLAEICDIPYAVATGTGTAALHVSLRLAGVGPDDEVLLPSLTFIATTNAVSYCGAVPHFCDSEDTTFGIDPEKLDTHLREIAQSTSSGLRNRATGRRIAALLPVHIFGHPCRVDQLSDLATRWDIPMIEDATEALGSFYQGKPIGHHGLLSVLSFNGNKIVTTGGGGAILTKDPILAKRAKHLTSTAKVPNKWWFEHDEVGYNYRLTNLSAAVGVAQLEKLEGFVAAKREIADRYAAAFESFCGAKIVREPEGCVSNYWLNTLLLDTSDLQVLDEVLQATHDAGLGTRPVWTPMHKLDMYKSAPAMDLEVCDSLFGRILNLPSSPGLELDRAR